MCWWFLQTIMHIHKDNSWIDVVGRARQVNEGGPAGNGSNSQELLCGGCSAHQAGVKCVRHGSEFTEWKCRYCCTIASFFCFGTTHMCNGCHEKWQLRPGCLTVSRRSCTPISCPLHTAHPDHGHEHCLGCALCRTNDWYVHVSNFNCSSESNTCSKMDSYYIIIECLPQMSRRNHTW